MHDAILSTKKAVTLDREKQMETLKVAYQAIDKALKRGIIKKNTAARKKSRLAQLLKKSVK